MIFGSHVIVFSNDADADRAFFRDVLGFSSVDAGNGWLIFALPPAEAAIHPADESPSAALYFMCDDLQAEMSSLAALGVTCSEVEEARWGSVTKIALPAEAKSASTNRAIHRPSRDELLVREAPAF